MMTTLTLIDFVVRACGFMSAFRWIIEFGAIQSFSRKIRRLGVIVFISVIILAQIFAVGPLSVAAFTLIFHFLGKLLLFWLQDLESKRFRSAIVKVLDLTILRMQTGQSFRSAFLQATRERAGEFSQRFALIYEAVVFQDHTQTANLGRWRNDPVVRRLIEIDQTANGALRKLESLRERLRFNDRIRHRSGQVTYQVRMQSILMSLIYIVIASVAWWNWKSFVSLSLFGFSLALFLLGMLLVWTIGRRIRWTI